MFSNEGWNFGVLKILTEMTAVTVVTHEHTAVACRKCSLVKQCNSYSSYKP